MCMRNFMAQGAEVEHEGIPCDTARAESLVPADELKA